MAEPEHVPRLVRDRRLEVVALVARQEDAVVENEREDQEEEDEEVGARRERGEVVEAGGTAGGPPAAPLHALELRALQAHQRHQAPEDDHAEAHRGEAKDGEDDDAREEEHVHAVDLFELLKVPAEGRVEVPAQVCLEAHHRPSVRVDAVCHGARGGAEAVARTTADPPRTCGGW